MREPKQKLIISFPSTTAAMAMEDVCKKRNYDGRLIPTPREVTAGCGLSWACDPSQEDAIRALINQENLLFDQICTLFLK